jgi:hypothetical protein
MTVKSSGLRHNVAGNCSIRTPTLLSVALTSFLSELRLTAAHLPLLPLRPQPPHVLRQRTAHVADLAFGDAVLELAEDGDQVFGAAVFEVVGELGGDAGEEGVAVTRADRGGGAARVARRRGCFRPAGPDRWSRRRDRGAEDGLRGGS